ncbi:hypothetical protein D9611_008537 [Ephemerocybe angulata]|uniref:F-box domain-containing protein n=1 Tax=Ephemerocybe angulata TaxID=980116 RepID=A0A8H5EUV5_9AGAR|nr:hypothetical protein D9611_008537 [Tulosesus angulatus]
MSSYNNGWDLDGLPRGLIGYPWASDDEEDDLPSSDERWTSSDGSEEEDDFSEENYSDEEPSEGESDEDEAHEEVQKRTVRKRRPKAPALTILQLLRLGKDLSFLPKMPLDILFEIFSLMEPMDLVNLLRVNKMIRTTLLRPNAQFVWAASRTRKGAPEPSKGFTEAAWAMFLFGDKCELCGSMRVYKVDWLLRRRACGRCKREHLQPGRQLAAKFPQYDIAVLQYIPYWEMPDRKYSTGDAGKNKLFWDDDFHNTGKRWASLQKACLRGETGAEKAFESWKEQRKAILEAAKQASVPCSSIRIKRCSTTPQDAQEFKDAFPAKAMRTKFKRDRIRERFIPLGYTRVDIDEGVDECVREEWESFRGRIPTLRDADWVEFKRKCEPYIEEVQRSRLERELEAAKKERMELFRGCCEKVLSTMRPSERHHCPPIEVFRPSTEISSLVDAQLSTSVKAEDFQPFVSNLAAHISKYKTRQREEALATLPTEYRDMPDPFDLARFIFRCGMHQEENEMDCSKFLVTWPMVTSHTCNARWIFSGHEAPGSEFLPKITLNERASAIAVELIAMSGLDPDTATVRDMDERGALFVCNNCQSKTITVHTWRTAVFHPDAWYRSYKSNECRARDFGYGPVSFRLANEMEKKQAQEHLKPVDATTKSDIKLHLKNIHGITEPKEGVDFFFNEACRFILHSPFVYDSLLRCIHPKCRKPDHDFSERGLRSHTGSVHGVRKPVINVDYIVFHPPRDANWKMKMQTTLEGAATNETEFKSK